MKQSLIILLTISSFVVGSCLIIPKQQNTSKEDCKLVTKSWTLEVHELGKQNECKGCGDFIRGIVECGSSEDCIKLIATVSVGWTVVSTSVVVLGNTVHWIEKQGRCEKSIVRSSINKLYETTVDVGGIVLESGNDFVNLFQQKNTNTQK